MEKLAQAGIFGSGRVIDDGDMLLRRALPAPGVGPVGPFVFLDHYLHVTRRGIGDRPHPHAGIEVISYLIDGEVHHRDSMGNSDVIRSGEVQVIRAGRGMLHAEIPGGGRHGLQMWTSLPPEQKDSLPEYRRFAASDIETRAEGGCVLRVMAGCICGLAGPVVLARETLLAHASLAEGAGHEFTFNADLEAAAYVLRGKAMVDGTLLETGMFRRAPRRGGLRVSASAGPCDVLLFGGAKAAEPILFAGPFVMDTEQRLRQASIDYLSGAMGTLDGVPF